MEKKDHFVFNNNKNLCQKLQNTFIWGFAYVLDKVLYKNVPSF